MIIPKSPLLTGSALAIVFLTSCADPDGTGGVASAQHHKPLYAASYDDAGKELAWAEFQLAWTDSEYLGCNGRSKQMAYINRQAHNLGLPLWHQTSPGNWDIDKQGFNSVTADVNKLPPDVKRIALECVQFGEDVLKDEAVRQHNGLATAYDQAGAREAGGAVLGLLGGLAGVAGGGSGLQIAQAAVPVGTDAMINASSSQSDIATAMIESSSALQQKYGEEHARMKASLATLIQKYGAQYPDLVTATADAPARKVAFISQPTKHRR